MVDAECRGGRGQAGTDHRPAATQDLRAEGQGLHGAGHLEGIVDPAAGRRKDRGGTVRIGGVVGVGGAELPGEAELLVGEIDGEPRVACTFSDRRDPGCDATTAMLAQSALALACDDLPRRGGILTPASALGLPLAERLRRLGTTIEVGDYGRLAA